MKIPGILRKYDQNWRTNVCRHMMIVTFKVGYSINHESCKPVAAQFGALSSNGCHVKILMQFLFKIMGK